MPFYLAWLCKKGQCTKILFWLLTHLSNIFVPYIKNLETYFAMSICFEFWHLCLEEIQKICKITRQNLKSYTFLDVFPVQCIQDQSLKIYQMTKAYTEVCWQFGISQWCEWNITLYFCIENNQTYKMTKIVLLRIFALLRNSTTVTKLT